MASKHQNGTHPYSSGNTKLKNEMEAAVREVALPRGVDENGSHSDDGYSWVGRVADLEGEVLQLKNEFKSYKEQCRNWFFVFEEKHTLQNFEENLALYLYPRGRVFGKTEIFPRLMNWLYVRRNTPQGVVANSKWLKIKQEEVQWSPHHQEVLMKFRNLLPSTTQSVEMWNPVSFTEIEMRCIANLNCLSERLTKLIEDEENERELIETL
ncbi:Hypothetical predicted protein [Paramuricea clavata]|uniref:Uncharacterized protein n=1 Tax=Paramuricea clavata TaxID=317549 RepID=A0A7D9LLA2_PARCT|nr:Hypothetical predicted protein [Paramuricea clavata]